MDGITLGGLIRGLSKLRNERTCCVFVPGFQVEAHLLLHSFDRSFLRAIQPSALLILSQAFARGSDVRNRTHLFEVSSSRIVGQE